MEEMALVKPIYLKGFNLLNLWATDHGYLNTPKARKLFTPFRLNKTGKNKDSKFKIDFLVKNKIFTYELWGQSEIKIE